jgi:hypothetical protein
MGQTRKQRREGEEVEATFRQLFGEFTADELRMEEVENGVINRDFYKDEIDALYRRRWKNFAIRWKQNPKHSTTVSLEYWQHQVNIFRQMRDRWAFVTEVRRLMNCPDFPELPIAKLQGTGRSPEEAIERLFTYRDEIVDQLASMEKRLAEIEANA